MSKEAPPSPNRHRVDYSAAGSPSINRVKALIRDNDTTSNDDVDAPTPYTDNFLSMLRSLHSDRQPQPAPIPEETTPNVSTNGSRDVPDHDNTANDNNDKEDATFLKLMQRNRNYRLYLASYIITHTGEWLTYIASIALAEHILDNLGRSSRTAISILVVVRLVPNVLLAPFGGVVADGWDRRQAMVLLDILGAISPLLFLVALQQQSILLIYVVTFLQQSIAGLYEPCRSSIIPMLVTKEAYLKKATTLAGLAWAAMAAVGSATGGFVVSVFGLKTCFALDFISYLTSAYLMYLMGGTWKATSSDENSKVSIWDQIHGMTVDGIRYLRGSWWGALVLLKGAGGIVYGACDVLNVSFSEPSGVPDAYSAARLGALFACAGIGCVLGPLVADRMTDMRRAISLQQACILGLGIMALGLFGMGRFYAFFATCLFSILRACGASINWINSSLLLQKYSSPEMLGRVLSIDYALALLTEASAAYLCGILQDQLGFTAEHVSYIMSGIGLVITILWSAYHTRGLGAASPQASAFKGQYQEQAPSETTPLMAGVT